MQVGNLFLRGYYKLFQPKRRKVESVKTMTFSGGYANLNAKGIVVIAPMESGKNAYLRCYEVWHPSDPGDQYFFRWEFLAYVKDISSSASSIESTLLKNV